MPQLKINSGFSESPNTPAFFIIAFSLLFLSGCASMMPIPEGPTQATLAVEKGRVLVSHGEVYEAGKDGMLLEPDVRVIVLEGAKAKVIYEVAQEGEETAFNCEVELEANSQLIVNGAQDCANGEIVANNINVTAQEAAAAAEEESQATATIASIDQPDNPVELDKIADGIENDLEATDPSVTDEVTAGEQFAAADVESKPTEFKPVAAIKDIDMSEADRLTPPSDMPSVGAISTAEDSPRSLAKETDGSSSSSAPEQIAGDEETGVGAITEADTPLVRKTIVSSRTIKLPKIDMQSIAAITKATDVPLILQSLPQRTPGIKYIDAVIMPDNS